MVQIHKGTTTWEALLLEPATVLYLCASHIHETGYSVNHFLRACPSQRNTCMHLLEVVDTNNDPVMRLVALVRKQGETYRVKGVICDDLTTEGANDQRCPFAYEPELEYAFLVWFDADEGDIMFAPVAQVNPQHKEDMLATRQVAYTDIDLEPEVPYCFTM